MRWKIKALIKLKQNEYPNLHGTLINQIDIMEILNKQTPNKTVYEKGNIFS